MNDILNRNWTYFNGSNANTDVYSYIPTVIDKIAEFYQDFTGSGPAVFYIDNSDLFFFLPVPDLLVVISCFVFAVFGFFCLLFKHIPVIFALIIFKVIGSKEVFLKYLLYVGFKNSLYTFLERVYFNIVNRFGGEKTFRFYLFIIISSCIYFLFFDMFTKFFFLCGVSLVKSNFSEIFEIHAKAICADDFKKSCDSFHVRYLKLFKSVVITAFNLTKNKNGVLLSQNSGFFLIVFAVFDSNQVRLMELGIKFITLAVLSLTIIIDAFADIIALIVFGLGGWLKRKIEGWLGHPNDNDDANNRGTNRGTNRGDGGGNSDDDKGDDDFYPGGRKSKGSGGAASDAVNEVEDPAEFYDEDFLRELEPKPGNPVVDDEPDALPDWPDWSDAPFFQGEGCVVWPDEADAIERMVEGEAVDPLATAPNPVILPDVVGSESAVVAVRHVAENILRGENGFENLNILQPEFPRDQNAQQLLWAAPERWRGVQIGIQVGRFAAPYLLGDFPLGLIANRVIDRAQLVNPQNFIDPNEPVRVPQDIPQFDLSAVVQAGYGFLDEESFPEVSLEGAQSGSDECNNPLKASTNSVPSPRSSSSSEEIIFFDQWDLETAESSDHPLYPSKAWKRQHRHEE